MGYWVKCQLGHVRWQYPHTAPAFIVFKSPCRRRIDLLLVSCLFALVSPCPNKRDCPFLYIGLYFPVLSLAVFYPRVKCFLLLLALCTFQLLNKHTNTFDFGFSLFCFLACKGVYVYGVGWEVGGGEGVLYNVIKALPLDYHLIIVAWRPSTFLFFMQYRNEFSLLYRPPLMHR